MRASENTSDTYKKAAATAMVLVVITLLVIGARALAPQKASMQAAAAASGTPAFEATAPTGSHAAGPSAGTYKDGTYTATGSYDSPGGMESIGVSLTVQSGSVVSASVTPQATDGDSQEYQDMFVNGYQQYVVGKSLSSLHVSRVSGSSLTPEGFNNAVEQIKAHAQS